ncbi:MAG TPA: hypothetical protein VGQ59_09165 [Cyclobacteriaceae bacterium]|jgi:hypothetical protein|nr:hypothetical protein [Cyclobacteriaceae bacterium]
MNLIERCKAPVPIFLRAARTIGLVLVTVGGTLLAAPVTLPAIVVTIGDYLTVAGGVMTAVSQVTFDGEEDPKSREDGNT